MIAHTSRWKGGADGSKPEREGLCTALAARDPQRPGPIHEIYVKLEG